MALTADQKQQLVALYDEATQAGDQQAMAKVRDALARDRAAGTRSNLDRAMTGPSPVEVQGRQEGDQTFTEGMVEGVKRAGAGIKQAVGYVADSVTRLDKAGRGLQQQVTAEENLRQKLDQLDSIERGQEQPVREVGAMVGEAAPLALAPEAGLPRATSLVGGLAKNVAAGGLGGLATFDEQGDNAGNAAFGAGLAGAIGAPFAVAPAIKNTIARAVNDATRGSRTEAAIANASRSMPNMQYTLSQRTGIPELKTLERAAYNSDMTNFYANQTDEFVTNFVGAMSTPVREGATLDGSFLQAQTRARELLATAKMNSSNAYENGMSAAAVMAERGGREAATQMAPVRIPNTDYLGQVRTLVQRAQDPVEGVSPEMSGYAAALLHDAQKGFLTPRELAAHLRGLTGRMKQGGEDGALAGRLRDALERDIDRLGQDGTLAANDVARQILDTRAEYRRSRELIDTMANSASFKLLGVADPTSVTSDALLSNFKSFTPERQRQVRQFLETESPDLLATMKQQVVTEAQQAARSLDAAADSRQSLDQLADNLFDEKRGFALRSSGLWSPEELRRVEEFKDGLRVIRNNRPTVGGAGTPIKPEDIVINLVSRSGEFASRQLARILMSSRGSEVFTDPAIYEAMRTLNRSTTGTPANLAARTALLSALQDNYEVEQQ